MTRRAVVVAVLLACAFAGGIAACATGRDAGVTISDAWSRATAPGQTVGAVYLTIHGGAEDDTLESASVPSSVAGEVQVHEMFSKGGTMQMRETDGIVVPGSAEVALAPGGGHVMLIDLASPLVEGDRIDVTLDFAKAGERTVSAQVRAQ